MKSSRLLRLVLIVLAIVASMLAASARAQSAIKLETVLQGLSSPVYVTHARDGSNRQFIVELGGRIKVLAAGATAATVFLDISSKVLSGGEQGLLGLAFHPQFANNARFFVNYTRRPDGATVIAEYRAGADAAATAATESILLTIPQPYSNHNGGMIEFGPDGYLYIGSGDGGSGNDPGNRAQNINDLLGKILRIDIDQAANGLPYSTPAGNPFVGATSGRAEIYAIGMRNPWRFSFDRSGGQLYVGDVGQGVQEEIDIVTAGGNYGWRVYEGNSCTGLDPSLCIPANYVAPVAQYGHSGGRCSITGGYVYRGGRATLGAGTYIYGDYCSGEIFALAGGVQSILLDTTQNISSFGEDEAGEIYVVSLGGTLSRIAAVTPQCTLTATPDLIPAGGTAYLFANCYPEASAYAWSNAGFAATQSGGSVAPGATTTYSVIGGSIAARQMLSYTSAQLERALGFTPISPTAKYRVVFNANLPSMELINFTKDIASGNLALAQAQIEDRPAAAGAASVRNVLLAYPSTGTEMSTMLRIVNPNATAAAVSATAYAESGTVVGSGMLATLAPHQILALSSAQIETALSYTPSSVDARYRLVLSADVPSFEVIASTRIPSTGNLYLAQAQTDNRTAGAAGSTTRNAYIVHPSGNPVNTTELRIINTTGQSAPLTASAYDDNGTLIASDIAMGILGANQMLSFTSAQLQSLFGYAPPTATAKWRLIFSAGLTDFEVINYAKDVTTGNLALAQPQTE